MDNSKLQNMEFTISKMLESNGNITYYGMVIRTDIEDKSFFSDANYQVSGHRELEYVYTEMSEIMNWMGYPMSELNMPEFTDEELSIAEKSLSLNYIEE